jgi:lysophospholipase L1-like esterase
VRHRKELALLVAAAAVGLLLAEVALRLDYSLSYSGTLEDLQSQAAPPPAGSSVYLGQILRMNSEPRLVYTLLPNLDVTFLKGPLRTNAEGWREEEIPLAKEPGTLRVVGIGDSVMFGWGVEESERYMDRLELGLNQAYPQRRWQSLALAVPGYNLVMEVAALETFGLEYSPDLIIIGFSTNDFCLPNFVLPRRSIWSLDSFLGLYLARGKAAAPRLVERLDVLIRPPPTGEGAGGRGQRRPTDFFATYCAPQNVPRAYRQLVGADSFLAALGRLVRIGRDHGIPVVFLHQGIGQGFLPLGVTDEAVPAEITQALAAATRLEGLIVADLTPRFRELLADGTDPATLLLSSADPHPSALGHELIASLLQSFLAERGILQQLADRPDGP